MSFSKPHRRFAFIALALIVLAMQMLALVHRIAHGSHGDHKSVQHSHQAELWLVVANGGTVSEEEWAQSGTDAATDPWHSHQTASDCERFDAIAAAQALLSTPSLAIDTVPTSEVFARDYIANLAARTPRAHARAPPKA